MFELSSFFYNKKTLKSHDKACKNENFCEIEIPSEKDNILELNQHMKLNKMPYIIFADIEPLIKKIVGCVNDPENSSTKKIGEHIPCRYATTCVNVLGIWSHRRQMYIISRKRLYEKVLHFFKRAR